MLGDTFTADTGGLPATFTIYRGDDVVYRGRFPDGKIEFVVDLPAGLYRYTAHAVLPNGTTHQAAGPLEILRERS